MRHFFLLFLLCLCISIPVLACEPSRDAANFTLADYVNNADIIFVGTVVDGEGYHGDSTILTAEIVVTSYLKGEGLELVQVSGFGYGTDCLSIVDIGDERIFFVQRASDGSLMAAYMSAHDAARTATPERIAEVQALTGQFNPPQALSFDALLRRFLARYWLWAGGTLLVVLVLGYGLWSARRKPERKAKLKREELYETI